MNYTQEMYDAGELPRAGMKAMYDGKEVTVIGFKTNGAIVFEMQNGFTNSMCKPTGNHNIKPIDTRTDKEKAIDDLSESYEIWNKKHSILVFIEWFIEDIKAGKITGVKWVGND